MLSAFRFGRLFRGAARRARIRPLADRAGREARRRGAATAKAPWCSKPNSRSPTAPFASRTACRSPTNAGTCCASSKACAARRDAHGTGHPLRLRLDRALGAALDDPAGDRRPGHARTAHAGRRARREHENCRRLRCARRRAHPFIAQLPAIARANQQASMPSRRYGDTRNRGASGPSG